MPSFIAYGAYCGCAIQIPFMWSSSRSVRERANANVKANMKMINMMARYWKFAALLKMYVRCLHNGHKKHPTILEDEPKYADPRKLTSFRVNAPHVQASILEFIGILYSKEDGYAKPGEEAGPEMEHAGTVGGEPPSRESISDGHEAAPVEYDDAQITSENHWAQPQPTVPFTPDSEEQCLLSQTHQLQRQQQQQQDRVQTFTSTLPYQSPNILPAQDPTLDIFQPLLDPEMLDLFPNGELPDFSAFDAIPLDLDHFDFGGLE
ncbi:hypothetical protein LTR07_008212 [Exophiala xenobiotica]|nr:hypothetical protein LTR40_001177 [Exophiala xenobiotica]KAK5514181.1 hypothetical protein LTR07_008212 [Exophiala xenobiotica]